MNMPRRIELFVGIMVAVGLALMWTVDWTILARLTGPQLTGVGTLTLLALFSEQQSVRIGAGKVSGGSSVGFLPIFTLLLLFGPSVAVASMMVTGPAVEYLIRKKEPIRAHFNVAQYVVATAVGGIAFSAAGGRGLVEYQHPDVLGLVGPFFVFAVTLLLINNASVTMAIALSQGMAFREVWSNLVSRSGANIFSDLLVAPVALAVAALYVQIGTVGLVLAILPLLFIRHAYLTTFRLQRANGDLLNALVKAIETRDPYTSGHSRRVAQLARRIGQGMGLYGRKLQELENAALLHDVGKIEGVYSEILKKRGALSPEERLIIESHVEKGADLLRSLMSLSEAVVLAVLHHHEHYDGTGYPNKLEGLEIPLGARVIKVCDAIDAMLSDRPYRKALATAQVLDQLKLYSGIQFDPEIVKVVIETGCIQEQYSPEPSPSIRLSLGRRSRRSKEVGLAAVSGPREAQRVSTN